MNEAIFVQRRGLNVPTDDESISADEVLRRIGDLTPHRLPETPAPLLPDEGKKDRKVPKIRKKKKREGRSHRHDVNRILSLITRERRSVASASALFDLVKSEGALDYFSSSQRDTSTAKRIRQLI